MASDWTPERHANARRMAATQHPTPAAMSALHGALGEIERLRSILGETAGGHVREAEIVFEPADAILDRSAAKPEEWAARGAVTRARGAVTADRDAIRARLAALEEGLATAEAYMAAERELWRHAPTDLAALLDEVDGMDAAVGTLLAVLLGDGGHRQHEVGTEQAAREALAVVRRLQQQVAEAPSPDEVERLRAELRGVRSGMRRECDRCHASGRWDGNLTTHPGCGGVLRG